MAYDGSVGFACEKNIFSVAALSNVRVCAKPHTFTISFENEICWRERESNPS